MPLSIAASIALFWISRRVFKGATSARYRGLFLTGVITVASLTNFGFVIGHMVARSNNPTDSRRYLPADLVAAFGWFRTNADHDGVLFSSYLTGNVAPSMTGLRVFLGHYGQTIRSDEKGSQVTAFYAGALTDEEARHLLVEHRVRFVIYGPFERAICDSFSPPIWLKLAYRQGDIEIFEVKTM